MGIRKVSCFMPFVLFQCLSLMISLSLGTDTISENQSLSGDQTIVSLGGNFELGFFKPGNSSSNFYIGMWYKTISLQTIVWVANRDRPISNKYSSELRIINGNLVLFNESQSPIWSTNMDSTTSNSIVAVLLDDGNLVVRNGLNLSELPIWQSFDHPTHQLLPGAQIPYNNRAEKKQLLTSWKNPEDPATGLFSFELDPNGSLYIMSWNRSVHYWTSTPWNGKILDYLPDMGLNCNVSYVSNENESYFTYSVFNPEILTRVVMDVSGQFKQFIWLPNSQEWNSVSSRPRQQCEVYAICGSFGTCNENSLPFCDCLTGFTPRSVNDWNLNDYSSGCVRNTNLQCGNSSIANGDKDRFLMMSQTQMGLPQHSESVGVASAAECESICLDNCSCTAYAYDENGCSIWGGELLNMQYLSVDDPGARKIYIRLASSEFSNAKSNKGVVIGAVVGSVAGIVLLGLGFIVICRWRRALAATAEAVESSLVAFGNKDLPNMTKNFSEKKDIDVPFFGLERILAATGNFSQANKLGQGGLGPVYKGMFPGGQEIAVKRLSSQSTQGLKEFKKSNAILTKFIHKMLTKFKFNH